jgi:hypothetical protein
MKEEAGSYYQKVNSWVTVGSNDGSGLFTTAEQGGAAGVDSKNGYWRGS